MSELTIDGDILATITVSGQANPSFLVSNPNFAVDQAGSLLYKGSPSLIDWESTTLSKSISFTVKPTCASSPLTLVLNVFDVNEPVTNLAPVQSSIQVAENTADSVELTTFTFDDPDVGQAHSYGLSVNPFGMFSMVGGSLVVSGAFDFETMTTNPLKVTVVVLDLAYQSLGVTIPGMG